MCAATATSDFGEGSGSLVTPHSARWVSLGQFCRECGAGPFKGARTRRKHERKFHSGVP